MLFNDYVYSGVVGKHYNFRLYRRDKVRPKLTIGLDKASYFKLRKLVSRLASLKLAAKVKNRPNAYIRGALRRVLRYAGSDIKNHNSETVVTSVELDK